MDPHHAQQQIVPCSSPASSNGHHKLPLSLYLSPKIATSRAVAFREAARSRPGYVRVVESEVDAIHVLPIFEDEEISALEMRRCRILGLPFAERLVRDPSCLEQVRALPLYDFILPPTISAIVYSGLQPAKRLRCEVLARWMGASTAEDFDAPSRILVTARVSLNPASKYQKALAQNIPILWPQFLEAAWAAKDRPNMEAYSVPALQGLGVCVDPRYTEVLELYKRKLLEHGAVMEPLDRAEVVIVRDTLAPLYDDARKIGLLCAPPLWLDRCFELRRCVPVTGELKVPSPQSSSLVSVCQGLNSFGDGASFEKESNVTLLGCVLCLSYLPAGEQSFAKALAWKCSAWTTLDPLDRAITHVLFRNVSKSSVPVSTPVDEDRLYFLDVAWLEKCVRENRRVSEQLIAQQLVHYDPVKELTQVRDAIANPQKPLQRRPSTVATTASEVAANESGKSRQDFDKVSATEKLPLPNTSIPANSEPVVMHPTVDKGLFAGQTLGFLDVPNLRYDHEVVESMRGHGATIVRGTPDSMGKGVVNFIICPFVYPLAAKSHRNSAPQVTLSWVRACMADGTRHPPENFPHFQPCPGTLPVPGMDSCVLRITAVEVRHSQRKRALLEELVQLVGARVADNKTKWGEITHMVCVVPSLVDPQQFENAKKRNKPMVSVQWLFDCYKNSVRQPEERYEIKVSANLPMDSPAKPAGALLKQGAFAVLDAYEIFISPCVLGSDNKLPNKAEELGATVHLWRDAEKLRSVLVASLGSASKTRNIVVLVEKEEVSASDCALAACISDVPVGQRNIFVQPSWLSETFSQRRSLPLEPFSALPVVDDAENNSKRQRTGEGLYAWQSAASTRLTELAENSRARALENKQQQKVTEGLRLADLRCKST